jgi:hypothetical protein
MANSLQEHRGRADKAEEQLRRAEEEKHNFKRET